MAWIPEDVRPSLYAFQAGIFKTMESPAIIIGGVVVLFRPEGPMLFVFGPERPWHVSPGQRPGIEIQQDQTP